MTEEEFMFNARIDQLQYDINKLTDKTLSEHDIDIYLDEAKYNIESAIQARKEMKENDK